MRVNSRYIPKVIYFFSFFLIYCFGNRLTANAFKKMGSLRKECSTTCHQAKHILKAKRNKFTQPECKTCHTGLSNKVVSSPFSTPESAGITAQNSRLLKSLIQAVPSLISKNKVKKSEKAGSSMAYVPAGEFIM